MAWIDLVGPLTSTADEIKNTIHSSVTDLAERAMKYSPSTEDLSDCVRSAICKLTATQRQEMAKAALGQLDQLAAEWNKLEAELARLTTLRNDAQQALNAASSKFNAARDALNAAADAGPDCSAFKDLLGFGHSNLDMLQKTLNSAGGLVNKYQAEIDRIVGDTDLIKEGFTRARQTVNTLLFGICNP